MQHTPDHARDKINLVQSERCVHERVADIYENALLQVQARLCYTRSEAITAMQTFVGAAPRKRRQRSNA